MSANVAGIVGGQLFRSDDLPFYHRGWTIAVAFMAVAVVCVIVLIVLYAWSNKKLRREGVSEKGDTVLEETASDSTQGANKLFNY